MGVFESLEEFLAHFGENPMIGGESGILTLLKFPYPKDVQEPQMYETVRIHAEWGQRPVPADEASPAPPQYVKFS